MTTRTQEWHADRALLSRYLAGALDAVTGASVEQHVSQCETCRAAVGRLLDPQLLERTWAGIRDGVERPTLPYPMRVARRLGLPEPTVVLLASAASLRGAWMVGAFLSLSFATLAAYASDGKALAPFLLAAPWRRCAVSPPPTALARTGSRRWWPPRRRPPCASIASVSPTRTLVAEATRRSGVVWVSPPGGAPALLWQLWHDDRMYVVGGGQEQPLPLTSGRATVTVRSAASQSGRVVEWAAEVDQVQPGSLEWAQVTPLLAAARLNARDRSDPARRWARESTLLRFTPIGLSPQ